MAERSPPAARMMNVGQRHVYAETRLEAVKAITPGPTATLAVDANDVRRKLAEAWVLRCVLFASHSDPLSGSRIECGVVLRHPAARSGGQG